jgi:hypothetical protein
MKKNDLKHLIKPLVKECIHEVLLEEGLLSNVVSEVVKGMQANLIVEEKTHFIEKKTPSAPPQTERNTRRKLEEQRRKMMDTIGLDAYNGVNLFEGTEPMESRKSPNGSADLGSATDPGVDISSLIGGASDIWNAIK